MHFGTIAGTDLIASEGSLEKRDGRVGGMGVRAFILTVLVVLLSWSAGYSKIDDSYIYARYVANALAGHGMVYNIGEHVNALTSPLYAYLLLFMSWLLQGNVLLATILLSGIFLLLASLLAERMVPFSGFFIASTAYFYVLVGMETSLFLFMLLAVTTLFQWKQFNWLPLASVLLVLSRFEGGLLVGLLAWQLNRKRARLDWISFVPAFVVAFCYLLLNHHFYGAYLPSSATAKLQQGLSGYWGRWPTAFLAYHDMVAIPFAKTRYIIYLVAIFSFVGAAQMFKNSFSRLILPFCGGLLAFYVLLNLSGFYFWYYAPFLLFAIMYASYPIPRTRVALVAVSLLLTLVVITNAFFLRKPWPEGRYSGYIDAGKWISQNTPPNARIEAAEIGLLGWYSNRYILDVIGLATPKNAMHIAHHDAASWLAEDLPDYILVHQPSWRWERVATNSPDYELLPRMFTGGIVILKKKANNENGKQPTRN
jgi:arabinofuranosyltransferase